MSKKTISFGPLRQETTGKTIALQMLVKLKSPCGEKSSF